MNRFWRFSFILLIVKLIFDCINPLSNLNCLFCVYLVLGHKHLWNIFLDPYCVTNPCNNGGSCSMTSSLVMTCSCPPGYNGTHCERKFKGCVVLNIFFYYDFIILVMKDMIKTCMNCIWYKGHYTNRKKRKSIFFIKLAIIIDITSL